MPKDIRFGQDARLPMAEGIAILAHAVGATMGPNGRTMVFDKGRFNQPMATKDGVSVAKEVQLADPFMELGRKIAYEACDRTNKEAGDATTCAAVLINAMVQEGLKHVVTKRNVIQLRSGMDKACADAVIHLKQLSKQIDTQEEIEAAASISAQDKVIGAMIAEVMEKIGTDGTIITDVKQGSPGMEWELVEGMTVERGYWSPFFINDTKRVEWNAEKAYVLVTDERLITQDQIIPVMVKLAESVAKGGKGVPRLIIFAPHFEGTVIDFFHANKQMGKLDVTLVKAPMFGEFMRDQLEDIACYTGAKFFSESAGAALPRLPGQGAIEDFGFCERVTVTADNTTLLGGAGDKGKVDERCAVLKGLIDRESDNFKLETYRERMSKLLGKVAVIRVAARTDIATEELRYRVDDALCAARAAVEEGIIPGGGVALCRCYQNMLEEARTDLTDDEQVGYDIVLEALLVPAWQIAFVAGLKGDVIVDHILSQEDANFGYNVITKEYEDMFTAEVVDPTKAIRSALENAVSVAGTLLTMEGAGVDLPEKAEDQAQGKR